MRAVAFVVSLRPIPPEAATKLQTRNDDMIQLTSRAGAGGDRLMRDGFTLFASCPQSCCR